MSAEGKMVLMVETDDRKARWGLRCGTRRRGGGWRGIVEGRKMGDLEWGGVGVVWMEEGKGTG